MIWRGLVRALALAISFASASSAQVPEPEGFRGEPYRAPVPDTLAGAEVLDDAHAFALWQSGHAAFIDVLPRLPRPVDLPAEMLWIEKPRLSIPGALWLPNTGYQGLSDADMAYFTDGITAALAATTAQALVFFCLEECWMSWNAARRALNAGHAAVFWYPRGTDGWAEQGYPLAPLLPWGAAD